MAELPGAGFLKTRKGTPQIKLVIIASFLLLSVLPGLSGCSADLENPISKIVRKLGGPALPPETMQELERFNQTYREYVGEADPSKLEYVGFAFKLLRTSYVRPVADKKLLDAAIKGIVEAKAEPGTMDPDTAVEAALDAMTASLDPHTTYFTQEEYDASRITMRGEFGGLGIEVTMQDGFVKVVAPIEDTPAAHAGLQSGDLITHVDGEAIKGKSLREAVRQMRGAPGTKILLKIRRPDSEDFDVTIVRAVIKVRAVKWRVEDRIGYIRVSSFSERVNTGVVKALAAIKAELGGLPDGLILDLRNNPGGLLNQSIILSDAFLDDGEIVSVRGRDANDIDLYDAEAGDLAENVPMVVLINGGSASASEIVASALKYHKRATVMGTRSFGKGSVQTIIALPVEGALKFTIALYYGPDGRTIQAQGVVPDILIVPEKKIEQRKEADAPKAFSAKSKIDRTGQSKIGITTCAEIGERKDRELGCAIEFLKAGSKLEFLAEHDGQQQL
jgi:carboxyl-terminal processing protease